MSFSSDPTRSDDGSPVPAVIWGAAIVLLAILSFLPALGDAYVLDDRFQVLPLHPAESFGAWIGSLREPWWNSEHNTLWRPVARLGLITEKSLSRAAGYAEAPTLFRFVSIALHALACWLAMRLGRSLGMGLAGAGAAGLLLAVHPLRSEAVHQIVGQAELLSAIFMTGGMILYLRQRAGETNTTTILLTQ
ncbi:hypothetical protein HYR69_06380, partial [Candidatus Sumerlaeota bacterium]|nr:hypothetical protein [Candidatus Sumerlaeota bacterium]